VNSQEQRLRDKLAAEAEHAETTRDAELPYQRRRRTGGQAVYGLRLPTERIEQLRRLGAARGVEPSVLARNWVIERLEEAEAGARDREEQWERDLRATTEHLRELLDERPGA
jgi:uncharacterized protein YdiU (UPF0061 family)